jgi:hypothetical protein
MPKLEPNDRVQLISGSHAMTVIGYAKTPTPEGSVPINGLK